MISLRIFLISVILHCHNDIYNSSIYMMWSNWKIEKYKTYQAKWKVHLLITIKTQKVLYTPRIGLFDASGLKKKIDLRTEN